jgi:hypothetical protein
LWEWPAPQAQISTRAVRAKNQGSSESLARTRWAGTLALPRRRARARRRRRRLRVVPSEYPTIELGDVRLPGRIRQPGGAGREP